MAMDGVAATGGVTGASSATPGKVKQKDKLDQMDFMQILVTQLRYQDPMNPMDDREFATQLAQFTSLDRISEMTRWTKLTYGLALVGQSVTYQTGDGGPGSGVVKALRLVEGKPILSVGDREIEIDQVISASKSAQ